MKSAQCFECRGDLEMWTLARVLWHQAGVKRMKRQFDDRIALTMLEGPIVALAHRLRERFEGRPQGRAADRVQLTADLDRPVFPHAQLQASFLAYMDAFWVLMLLALAAVPLALSLRKVKPSGGAPAGH